MRRAIPLSIAMAAMALAGSGPVAALTLTRADFDMYLYGITSSGGIPPGVTLEFAGLANDVDGDGVHEIRATIGTGSTGLTVETSAGVADFGKTFYAIADTPNNFRKPVTYIGSSAEVLVYREYVKDNADDKLTFTYTDGLLQAFVNPEFGPLCPSGDGICLNAGMLGRISVFDAANALVWERTDIANLNSNPSKTNPPFEWAVVGDLPWQPQRVTGGGFIGLNLSLEGRPTRPIDISAIGVGQLFTVQYQLFAYAYDRGSDLGFQRGSLAFAKDPLGDFGGGFNEFSADIDPSPVPLPASALLLAGAIAILGAARYASTQRADGGM